jgi:hypothetical protein
MVSRPVKNWWEGQYPPFSKTQHRAMAIAPKITAILSIMMGYIFIIQDILKDPATRK